MSITTASAVAPATPIATFTEGEFVVNRTFNAPRELVYKAWTDPNHLAHWWGPEHFTVTIAELDLRPGGIFLYSMNAPDGQRFWGKFIYREIVPNERIVLVNSFSDAEGNTIRAPWSEKWPLEVLSTITFAEQDGHTTINLRGYPINATEEERQTFAEGNKSMEQGWAGTLNKLEAELERVLAE